MRWMTASGWISFHGDEVYFSRIDLRGFLGPRGQGYVLRVGRASL
jgi:hypothetical protein